MQKLPYERIVIEADKLYQKAIHAPSIELLKYWYERYSIFLESTGWTPASFQAEEVRRIDEAWEPKTD